MVIEGEKKGKNFGFNTFTSLDSTKIIGFISISKQLKLDTKLIRFIILMRILSTISKPFTLNRHLLYKVPLLTVLPLAFFFILDL